MGYQITVSPSARLDLRGVVRYIALDDPSRAATFGRLLLSSTVRLADFPEMGRVVPEFREHSLREIIVRSYRVVYRLDHERRKVVILRFWHAARGLPEVG